MVGYSPGRLEAVAFKKGRRLTAVVETTGQPYKIVLHPAKPSLAADGRDADVINISVVDRQGREVPDAASLLHFSVTGKARIIGVGNGNPSSHEPDQYPDNGWQRHLFNGQCQVILQSAPAGAAGPNPTEDTQFTVTGEGLQDAQLAIPVNR
jgi:beta-galactosidase